MATRRELLKTALAAAGATLVGCGDDTADVDGGPGADGGPGTDGGRLLDGGLDSLPQADTEIRISTTSTASDWSPREVVNDGATLAWLLGGALSSDEVEIDAPVFDLSASDGTVDVIGRSATGFGGFDKLKVEDLEVVALSISAAPSLTVVRANDNQLDTFDVRLNPALRWVYLANNRLPSAPLDAILTAIDDNGQVDGVLQIANNAAALTSAAFAAYGSLIAKGWTIDVAAPPNPEVSSDDAPTLSGFHIRDSAADRIYFESSKPITASTVTGFVLSRLEVDGVFVAAGARSGHYFTVSDNFVYEDNILIRYEGGSDMSGGTKALPNFTLQYVTNNVSDKSTYSNTRWVTLSGNDSNNGLTEATAWRTIGKGLTDSPANCIINVKAGNYGAEQVVFNSSGTAAGPDNRKWLRGYKSTPGDITSRYYRYGDGALDPSEMPLLDGGDRSTAGNTRAMSIQNRSYITVENIQLRNYLNGIVTGGSAHSDFNIFRRIVIKDVGDVNTGTASTGITINSQRKDSTSNRLLDCFGLNGTGSIFRTFGKNHLVDGCEAYSDNNEGINPIQDYYFALQSATSCILRRCHAERLATSGGPAHGLSIRSNTDENTYNLMEDCTTDSVVQGIELRHTGTKYNVVRRVRCVKTHREVPTASAVVIRNDASFNIVENCHADGVNEGIRFYQNSGERGRTLGHDNVVMNCVFTGCGVNIVVTDNDGGGMDPFNNKILFNTFYGAPNMFNVSPTFDFLASNIFAGNLVKDVAGENRGRGILSIVQEDNAFHGGYAAPAGAGNIVIDPMFVDTVSFTPQNAALKAARVLSEVTHDRNGKERSNPATMGAVEID